MKQELKRVEINQMELRLTFYKEEGMTTIEVINHDPKVELQNIERTYYNKAQATREFDKIVYVVRLTTGVKFGGNK